MKNINEIVHSYVTEKGCVEEVFGGYACYHADWVELKEYAYNEGLIDDEELKELDPVKDRYGLLTKLGLPVDYCVVVIANTEIDNKKGNIELKWN